ncbi:uncharacterized protein AB9X84_008294 isoform 1-T4 [Acanthopagrus schlegelii]
MGGSSSAPSVVKSSSPVRAPVARAAEPPVRLISCFQFLPPHISELRVVLLGNSWSQRSSVGNFILETTEFNTEAEPDWCLTVRRRVKEKEIVLINTPDLLHPNMSEYRLRRNVETCERLSVPGPHVFLLVLQPEDFTEEHKLKLCRVLNLFSDQSFDRSLVLISAPREESPGLMDKYHQHPPLKEMIRDCHYRFLWQKDLEPAELLTRLGQVVKENDGKHLNWRSEMWQHYMEDDMKMRMMFKCMISDLHSEGAAASSLRHISSFPFLPPDMSELRVVLLGNSWSQRSSVGNFILGTTEFNTEEEPDRCLRVRGRVKEKEIVLINIPDLLHPNMSQNRLRELVETCERLSDPGPHVFLLVLQPEDFTEEHKLKLCRVLNLFSDQSFDHSLVLISAPREESPGLMDKYHQHPPLKEMIRDCHYRFLWQKDLEPAELLTRLGQVVKENDGKHLNCRSEMWQHYMVKSSSPVRAPVARAAEPPVRLISCFQFLPPHMSELRVVLLGNSWSQRSSVGNFILETTEFNTEAEPNRCLSVRGRVKEKEIVLINTPDLLHPNMSEYRLRRNVETCERLSVPGPHVFLLVLQPEDFTEEHKLKLCRVLNLFSDQSFDHSLVLISAPREESPGLMDKYHQHPPLKEMIRDCHYRFLWQKDLEPAELLTRLGQVVKENDGKHLNWRSERWQHYMEDHMRMSDSLSDDEDEPPLRLSSSFEFLPPNMSELRVVLLGNSWSQRSSVGNFMLGTTVFNTEAEPDWCLTVRGRVKEKEIVLINIPDLLHPNMSEYRLRRNVETCVRLSDPGPHVFLLVLQPEDFTEEHKLKLCSVLNLFSDQSFDHSLVLISAPREESPGLMDKYHQHPPLKEMIRDCHYRFLWQKDREPAELLTRLGQVVKENYGKHLNCRSEIWLPQNHRRIMIHRMMMSDSLSEGAAALSLRRSSSFEFLPPNMSELRVVLLGNSWSQRSSVGNFMLGTTVFNTEEEPDRCLRVRGRVKEKRIVLINIPDLLHPNMSEYRLRRNVETCERLSAPGPHVILLVLQPEDFTKKHKLKLCRVLNLFSYQSFDHSLVLISAPRKESPGLMDKYHQHPPLKEMIRDCHYRFLWQKDREPAELLTRLGQVVKENYGKHLNCRSEIWQHYKEDEPPLRRISSFEFLPPNMSELRVVLLGNSWSQRSSVGNFMLGTTVFNTEEEPDRCLSVRGRVKKKRIVLINTPDLLHPNMSEDRLTEHVGTCVRLSDPGPHVILLVLQPEDFTEEHKLKLCRVLNLFSDRSFHNSLVLISAPREKSPGLMDKYHQHPPLKEMIRDCHYRFLWQKDREPAELLTRLGQVVKENYGKHLNCRFEIWLHYMEDHMMRMSYSLSEDNL